MVDNLRLRNQPESLVFLCLLICGGLISVVSMGEIAKGLAAMQEGARKRKISQWVKEILKYNASQVLDIDVDTAMLMISDKFSLFFRLSTNSNGIGQ